MTITAEDIREEDCITIIAPSVEAAMHEAQVRGLGRAGYAIAGRVTPHRFSLATAEGAGDLFDGATMIAATWVRQRSEAGPERSAQAS